MNAAIWRMVGFLALLSWTRIAAAEGPPNLVVVLIDDLGWGDFGCFGNREVSTPEIDRLASEGLRFSQFYVNAPICSPSRCALMTGQYPQRWRITSFLNNREENRKRGMAQWLDPEAVTLPRLLKSRGYATGHFGKWHLGGQRDVADAPPITAYGIDESLTNFEGMGPKLLPLTLRPGEKQPGKIWADAERLGGPVTWTLRSKITGGYVDRAIAFMKEAEQAGKPFYVNVWPDDVHSPFWPDVEHWQEGKRKQYQEVLHEMDQQLKTLFSYLRESPKLRDNTIVLLCSDNGPEAGAGTTASFRGTKGQLYEGGIRSPLIVWAPGLMPEARYGGWNRTSIVAEIDLLPSLVKLGGVESAATDGKMTLPPDGEDLSSVLIGESQSQRHGPIFWRRPPDRPGPAKEPLPDLAVRDGQWKLLCRYDGSEPQLYDLSAEDGEAHDLAEQEKEVVTNLVRKVLSWNESMPRDNGPDFGRNRGEGEGS